MNTQKKDFSFILISSSFNYISKIFHGLIQLVFAIFLGKLYGPEITGLYFVCFAYFEFAKLGACYASDHTARRFLPIIKNTRTLLADLNKITIGLSIVIIVFAMIYVLSPICGFEFQLKTYLLIVLFTVPFSAMSLQLTGALQGLKRIRDAIIIENLLPASIRLSVMLFLYLMGVDAVGVFIAFFLSFFIPFVYGKIRINTCPEHHPNNTETSPGIKKIFSFSTPLIINQMVDQMVVSGVPILLSIIISTTEVALYGVAARLVLPLNLLLLSVSNIFSPIASQYIAGNNVKQLEFIHNRLTVLCILISTPVMWAFVFFPKLIVAVFGAEFIPAYQYVIVLSIGVFLLANFGFLGEMLVMAGKTKVQLKCTFIGNVFGLILALAFHHKTGPIAFAAGPIIGVLSTRLLYLIQLRSLNINPLSVKNSAFILLALSPLLVTLFNLSNAILILTYAVLVMILLLWVFQNRKTLLNMDSLAPGPKDNQT